MPQRQTPLEGEYAEYDPVEGVGGFWRSASGVTNTDIATTGAKINTHVPTRRRSPRANMCCAVTNGRDRAGCVGCSAPTNIRRSDLLIPPSIARGRRRLPVHLAHFGGFRRSFAFLGTGGIVAFISGAGRLNDPWGDLVNYFRDSA